MVKMKGGMKGGENKRDSCQYNRKNEKWNTGEDMCVGRRVVIQF